jgi:hypothetical protein
MNPAMLRVKLAGHAHTALRKQVDNYLTHSRGFKKQVKRRKLVNHFIRSKELSPEECTDIVSGLYAIQKAFGPSACIKEVIIDCFPDISLRLSCKSWS